MPKWYDIKAEVREGVSELWIYDEIGEDWFGEGITAKNLVAELNDITSGTIDVHLNSPGGSVFDGQAIYTALVNHPANVTVHIDGIAASIASVIACAGNDIVMAENAMMMIHDPWSIAIGNAEEMRKNADVLDAIAKSMVAVYVARTGKDEAEIRDVMQAETWFTASEALDFGLATEVAPALRMAASFDLSKFKHAPKALVKPDLAKEVEDLKDIVASLAGALTKEPDSVERDTEQTINAGLADLLLTARR